MITAFDVERQKLIASLKEKLKSELKAPEWTSIVKSGPHVERPPEQGDFFYIRAASVLWQAYKDNTVGVNKLRKHYGKSKNKGVKPTKHVKAGGKVIRTAMQQLEKAGYLQKHSTGKGRVLSAKGRKLLDLTAKEVA